MNMALMGSIELFIKYSVFTDFSFPQISTRREESLYYQFWNFRVTCRLYWQWPKDTANKFDGSNEMLENSKETDNDSKKKAGQ